jgi:osomolarity two-component system response regulator SSK1
MEWGCMQALIDFDGWRKWKEAFSQQNEEREAVKKAQANNKAKPKKNRSSLAAA